jgi:hypothetical protein
MDKTFTIKINIIRRRLAKIGRNKSVGPDGIPSAILKMGWEGLILYLSQLLDITINSGTVPGEWKNTIVFPIHKGGDRSTVKFVGPSVKPQWYANQRNTS